MCPVLICVSQLQAEVNLPPPYHSCMKVMFVYCVPTIQCGRALLQCIFTTSLSRCSQEKKSIVTISRLQFLCRLQTSDYAASLCHCGIFRVTSTCILKSRSFHISSFWPQGRTQCQHISQNVNRGCRCFNSDGAPPHLLLFVKMFLRVFRNLCL